MLLARMSRTGHLLKGSEDVNQHDHQIANHILFHNLNIPIIIKH